MKLILSIIFLSAALSSYSQAPQISWVHTATTGPLATQSGSNPSKLNVWNSKLYFWASDSLGSELWSYDEITTPKMVYDLYHGSGSGSSNSTNGGYHARMAAFKNKLYMKATDSLSGTEVFAYSGTGAQVQVSHIWPSGASDPYDLVAYGSKLYFAAYRSTNGTGGSDLDLYSYDGINSSSRYNITGPSVGVKGCSPDYLTPFNGKLCFIGTLPSGQRALFELDTITNTANAVTNGTPGTGFSGAISDLTLMGGKLYFIGGSAGFGGEVWSYDGTLMKRITDVATGNLKGAQQGFGYYNGEVYFSGSTDGVRFQLYKINSDGTGATLVYTVNPSGDAGPNNFFVYSKSLYFLAKTATAGMELWRYNGSTCSMVTDLNPGAADIATMGFDYAIFNGHLYFNGSNGVHNNELYRLNDPTSVQLASWSGTVKLYPNPTGGDVTLSVTLRDQQTLSVLLTDMSGKAVFSTEALSFYSGTHDIVLPLRAFASGQYVYKLINAERNVVTSGSLVKSL